MLTHCILVSSTLVSSTLGTLRGPKAGLPKTATDNQSNEEY